MQSIICSPFLTKIMCHYRKWKRYETRRCRSRCKTGLRTDIWNEIFAIGFVTEIKATEINNKKKEVQIRNTSLLLDL